MATTPTYSWPIPDDTDLVKDGAEAIRDLGNAIDTTVDGLGVGLVHIATTSSGGTVASFSVEDVFSADYKNYKIVLSDCTNSTTADIRMRMRVSAADNSTSNYRNQKLQASGTSVQGTRATETSFEIGGGNTNFSNYTIELFNPFETKNTLMNSITTFAGDGSPQVRLYGAGLSITDSFTGFTIFPSTGTITFGDVKVYGYK